MMISMRSHLVFLMGVSASVLSAQAQPGFEVASVKPNKSGTLQTNIGMLPNGVNFVNLPLRAIIQFAYGINQPSKLFGVPDWAATERYDINARAAGPVTADERRSMLQALLADRFKLVARREQREVSVLALKTVRNDGKLGPNMGESKGCIAPGGAAGKEPATANDQTPVCGVRPAGNGRLVLIGVPVQQFSALLGTILSRTIVDEAGLTGRYDIDFTFTPEQPLPAAANTQNPDSEPGGPSIYTALRDQLGLKLELERVREEVLVIEHVERQPSDN